MLFLRKLVNNGKNVDSANLRMVFSISLVFCLATIGVCVFRCGDFGCRTFCFSGVFAYDDLSFSTYLLYQKTN